MARGPHPRLAVPPTAAALLVAALPFAAEAQDAGARSLSGRLQCVDFNQTRIDYTLKVDDLGGQSIRIQGRPNGTRTQPFELTIRADRPLGGYKITIASGNMSNPYDGYVGLEASADGRRIALRPAGGATRCDGEIQVVSGPPLGAAAAPAPVSAPPAAPRPAPPAPADALQAAPPPQARPVQPPASRPSAAHPAPAATASPAPTAATPPVAAPTASKDDLTVELAFWDAIKNSTDPADYRAYLEAYPSGRFAALARNRVRAQAPAQAAAPPPAAAARPPELALDYGRYHALVIGNNAYRDLPKLQTAIADARAVAGLLRDTYGFEAQLLENATRADVLRALAALRARLTAGDNLLIYYAGHGHVDKGVDLGYWLPVDAERDNPANWIANTDLTAAIRGMSAKHVLVVADSCYSGSLLRSAAIPALRSTPERMEWLRRMSAKRARVVLSSGGLEPVMDGGGGGHSVFAKAFLEALGENEAVLDGQSLFDRIKRPVALNAPQTPEYADIRQAGHDGGDFLFVRRR